ncbi:AzlC family ABC transporter permease [Psychromonas sp. 14N.309.X.WAT.B.A12]|uniref:AzlC family ABC transporter permease n=1 Tax=unclassified Psychromonas TaxID=2614957 RepID=UPI0025B17E20|nr:AzlC family ABC transporter permease [Psychromonas sp. 14N.309.X.WAT.B.A12]MDN2663303.1 AzlC family ABC transporter permease [Psychromonas sp. 14N.309.X.WAT.B.A12]
MQTNNNSNSIKKAEFLGGAKAAVPLIVGGIPFGILFGTLAPSSGLSVWATMAMSLIVFAGSAQFIVLALIAVQAPLEVILLTTFVVNLRHLLYATALVPHISHLSLPLRSLLAFGLTDETFANMSQRYQPNSPLGDDHQFAHFFYLGSMFSFYVSWSSATAIGLILGNVIPDMTSWGLEFAMSVTFIGMVIPYLNTKAMFSAMLSAAIASLYFAHLPNKLGLIVSALIGVAIGLTVVHFQKASIPQEKQI